MRKPLIPLLLMSLLASASAAESRRPNIVLIMSDDQGWGETGYNGHPHLKTPILDEMAGTGLRLNRFYAASPVCTPTRASVMTGRHANRSGAFSWNWSIRPEEVTIAQVLKDAGYRTAHFGKWHVGAVKKGSQLSPNSLGFDESLSHDNFFELNPALSRNGEAPERIDGEGSAVVVDEALKFARKVHAEDQPFFIVIWFGSPHDPYQGLQDDVALYEKLGAPISHRFAEITAMDRAVGSFRDGLSKLDERKNTLIWFNSDNGITHEGIPEEQLKDLFNGELRGRKGSVTEGGLRVPGIIEWPEVIDSPRASDVAAVTSDIMPTILDLLGLEHPDPERPLDGVSLKRLIVDGKMAERAQPIGAWTYKHKREGDFEPWIADRKSCEMITMTTRQMARQEAANGDYKRDEFINFKHPVAEQSFTGPAAWIGNRYKLVLEKKAKYFSLYDFKKDRRETMDIAASNPEMVRSMKLELEAWQRSVVKSLTGADYEKESYRIGLSMYSLRQLFRDGSLHAFDYPAFARDTFGIVDIDVWDGGFPKDRKNDPKFYMELKKRADEAGSNIFLLMAGAVKANQDSVMKRKAEAKNFYGAVDNAVLLGAKFVRVFLKAPDLERDVSMSHSIEALKPLVDYAQTKGIIIVIEPGASNWAKKGSFLADLAREMNHPACRLMPDFGKMKNDDPYGGTEAMMPWSDGVSAKSHDFDQDGNEVGFDYVRLMKTVVDSGFTGIVSIEYEGKELPPVEGVRATQKLLERLLP